MSTINGFYDVDYYDTPGLHISNTTAYDFTGVTLTFTGYQGVNAGVVQTFDLGTISAGSTSILTWVFSAQVRVWKLMIMTTRLAAAHA